jgi:hypothetical protein
MLKNDGSYRKLLELNDMERVGEDSKHTRIFVVFNEGMELSVLVYINLQNINARPPTHGLKS